MNEVTDETSEKASGGRSATFRSVAYVPLFSHLANRGSRKTKETAPPWTGTESARLAPKRIASRPASTDMQDSGVDGPHTTGMHRTSYRLHTPSPGAPEPLAPARASSFTFLPPSPSRALSLSLSLSHTHTHKIKKTHTHTYTPLCRYSPFLFAAFFATAYQLPLRTC
ncbi:hypothetical protein ALC56_14297 [Trachymyrmex septentrionalis]|uniref:Uncharacterized protein n=1 Tax=Trachymyrmex septentrionalis TaxID=34720 RepID=A0A195ETD0_9HYME|nr:hypothetical protein ALC56_14297 [Trachymyrmex septentrionalis]